MEGPDPADEAGERVILGIETSCDETAVALVTRDGDVRSSVVASQAELHARYGGVVPEVASRRHLELAGPVLSEALEQGGVDARRRRRRRGHPRPRPDRCPPGRALGRQGARVVASAAARPSRPPARPRRVPLPGARAARAALPLPARERRPHAAARRPVARAATTSSARRSTTPPARPSTRARACSDSATREGRRSTARPRDGDPGAYAFPVARVPGFDFSFSGLKTALLYAVRDLSPDELERRRADLAASYQRAIVRALVERTRAAAAELGDRAESRSSEVLPPTRSCEQRSPTPPSRRSSSVPITQQ